MEQQSGLEAQPSYQLPNKGGISPLGLSTLNFIAQFQSEFLEAARVQRRPKPSEMESKADFSTSDFQVT